MPERNSNGPFAGSKFTCIVFLVSITALSGSCSTARTRLERRDDGHYLITANAESEASAYEAARTGAVELCSEEGRELVMISEVPGAPPLTEEAEQALGVAATLMTGGRLHGYTGSKSDEFEVTLEFRCR